MIISNENTKKPCTLLWSFIELVHAVYIITLHTLYIEVTVMNVQRTKWYVEFDGKIKWHGLLTKAQASFHIHKPNMNKTLVRQHKLCVLWTRILADKFNLLELMTHTHTSRVKCLTKPLTSATFIQCALYMYSQLSSFSSLKKIQIFCTPSREFFPFPTAILVLPTQKVRKQKTNNAREFVVVSQLK